jgi:hypothetical protein
MDREIPITFERYQAMPESVKPMGEFDPVGEDTTVASFVEEVLRAAGFSDDKVAGALGYLGHYEPDALQKLVYLYIKSDNIVPGPIIQSEEDGNVYILEA